MLQRKASPQFLNTSFKQSLISDFVSFYFRYEFTTCSYTFMEQNGAYVILPSCLFTSHTLHTTTESALRIYWFLHRTFFHDRTNKSISRLPIIINLLKFVFFHRFVAQFQCALVLQLLYISHYNSTSYKLNYRMRRTIAARTVNGLRSSKQRIIDDRGAKTNNERTYSKQILRATTMGTDMGIL